MLSFYSQGLALPEFQFWYGACSQTVGSKSGSLSQVDCKSMREEKEQKKLREEGMRNVEWSLHHVSGGYEIQPVAQ